MRSKLKYFLLLTAFIGMYDLARSNLDDLKRTVDTKLYNSTRLEDASRLFVELQGFELMARRYVEGDQSASLQNVKLAFDLLWSRTHSLSSDKDYDNVHMVAGAAKVLSLTKSGLYASDAIVANMSRGDTAALRALDGNFSEVRPLMSDFANAAYRIRLEHSVASAVSQKAAARKIDVLQMGFLVFGALSLFLMMAEVLRIRRLNLKIKERERQIVLLGLTDPLTGLANRRLLIEQIAARLAEDGPGGSSLLLIDLDGFKAVNDKLGHPVGDELLRHVAKRLQQAAEAGSLVARLGGDEFAILANPGALSPSAIASAVISLIGEPFSLGQQTVQVSASVGLVGLDRALHPDASVALGDADVALYEAKRAGRACCREFEAALRSQRDYKVKIDESLKSAVINGEIGVKFHPQIEIATGNVCGVEALARWLHPELGEVPVDFFVQLAERQGLIRTLDFHILMTACREILNLGEAGAGLRLSVNVSPVEAGRKGYAEELLAALDQLEFPLCRLTLELTENAVMEDFGAVAQNLDALSAAGIRIAIDDFGSGYSNLSYLARFSFNALKVDKKLAEKISESEKDRIVLSNIAALAKGLDMVVVMEGVENQSQLDFVRSIGIPQAQGFLFAKPLTTRELFHFLRKKASVSPRAKPGRMVA